MENTFTTCDKYIIILEFFILDFMRSEERRVGKEC